MEAADARPASAPRRRCTSSACSRNEPVNGIVDAERARHRPDLGRDRQPQRKRPERARSPARAARAPTAKPRAERLAPAAPSRARQRARQHARRAAARARPIRSGCVASTHITTSSADRAPRPRSRRTTSSARSSAGGSVDASAKPQHERRASSDEHGHRSSTRSITIVAKAPAALQPFLPREQIRAQHLAGARRQHAQAPQSRSPSSRNAVRKRVGAERREQVLPADRPHASTSRPTQQRARQQQVGPRAPHLRPHIAEIRAAAGTTRSRAIARSDTSCRANASIGSATQYIRLRRDDGRYMLCTVVGVCEPPL